jgi:uncharacterized membrane protein YdjX (TVP38/TMEM64 family)
VRGYAVAACVLASAMLALFGLAQALDVPLLADESPDIGRANAGAAATSFALLALDVVLPVPSSAVMVANGALFGWPAGAALSLSASIAAALLGGVIGRRGGPLLQRLVAPAPRARVMRAIEQHGALVIVVTRPVPIVAETAAILAGAAGMPLGRLAAAAAIGALPPAVAYALAGAVASSLGSATIVLACVLVLAALVWVTEQRREAAAA